VVGSGVFCDELPFSCATELVRMGDRNDFSCKGIICIYTIYS
jgi:hypothetical protein